MEIQVVKCCHILVNSRVDAGNRNVFYNKAVINWEIGSDKKTVDQLYKTLTKLLSAVTAAQESENVVKC